MAFYLDESEVWKCVKHPSRRRRSGICPTCLRDRLVTLCPECANTRPCGCCPATADSTSSSSSSSSSFSRFPYRGGSLRDVSMSSAGSGEVGRVSNLIESEPAFQRSRSVAIPFLRSRSKYVGGVGCDLQFVAENKKALPLVSRSKINFWSVFRLNKTKKCDLYSDGLDNESIKSDMSVTTDDYPSMRRSRSVAVGAGTGFSPAAAKRRSWYFPSPIKAFRQLKTSKVQVHERSPMHRG